MTKTRITITLLGLAFLFAVTSRTIVSHVSAQTQPNKRALVIGIGDYDSPVFPDLKYPANDVARMQELLESPHYGFKVTSLDDSTPDKPTRDNVLKYLRRVLITDSKEGDVVVFYYSGHGSSIRNSASDEADKRDETIVPKDAQRPKVDNAKLAGMKPDERKAYFDANFRDIRDKELVDIFNEAITKKKIVLTVIFDSCHSGSAARGDEVSKEVDAVDADIAFKPTEDEIRNKPDQLGAMVLSAAQDYQVATGGTHDLAGHEALYSHFTAAILSSLYDTPADLVSADETFQMVTAKMAADGLNQTPRMDTTDGRRVQPLFGGSANKSAVPRFTVGAERGATYLRAGLADGLTEGDELKRVLPAGKPPVNIRLKKVALDRSEIETIGDNDAEPGDSFEQTKWARAAKPDLTVYIPPAILTDAEYKQAVDDIKALPAGSLVLDPTDPNANVGSIAFVEKTGTNVAWRVGPSRLRATPIGSRFSINAAKLPAGTRVFAELPPTQAIRNEVVDALQKTPIKIGVATDRSAAQYELVGRYDPSTGGVAYAWMLRNGVVSENTALKQRLGEAAATAPSSMPPVTNFVDAGSVTRTSDLLVLAQRLAKIRYLLSLSSPVATAVKTFPYKLEVVDVAANAALRPGDIMDTRKWYEYRLRMVPGRSNAEVFPHFYVYLVDIDSNGFANVGEPIEFGSSPGASSRPFSAEAPPQTISLLRCTVSEDPVGTETIMALVMEQQSTNANALRLEGVRGQNFAARGSEDPLSGLLSSAGEVQTRDGSVSPNTWAMQHMVLRSSKLGPRPAGFRDGCKYPDPVTGQYDR